MTHAVIGSFNPCDAGTLGHFSGFLLAVSYGAAEPRADSSCQKLSEYAKTLGALPVTIATRDQALGSTAGVRRPDFTHVVEVVGGKIFPLMS